MAGRGDSLLALAGLAAAVCIAGFAIRNVAGMPAPRHVPAPFPAAIKFLAVGDINLGRSVGQRILEGDTLYPFEAVRDTLARFDLVFGNLESNLSDQGGETESPLNNLVFTGPPAGAESLRRAGIGLVSTANNHSLDYGPDAQRQTIESLRKAGILFSGTAEDTAALYRPASISLHGIRIALLACTDIMNNPGLAWRTLVADADTARVLPRLRAIRDSVDFLIVSYHGGDEYADRPATRTVRFARAVIDAGADLFLGHHPHVSYGIERRDGRYIAYSLGNFVFAQPARYWTQRAFALSGTIVKDSTGTRLEGFRCLPVRCGYQPSFLLPGPEADNIYERLRLLTMTPIAEGQR